MSCLPRRASVPLTPPGPSRVGPASPRGRVRRAAGRGCVVAVLVAATAATSAGPAAAATGVGPARPAATAVARPGDAALAEVVRRAVAAAGFADVVDFGPREGTCPGDPRCPSPAPRTTRVPNVDTAVIELDDAGRVVAAADVLLSRDYPDPVVVPVDADLRVSGVHWYRWDSTRADGSTSWTAQRVPADDLVSAPPGARYAFMSPYPASLFQLLVAAGTLHLVDEGLIRLDGEYHYLQAPGSTCLGSRFTDTRTTRALLDRMVTASDTPATCMLLKQLSDLGQLDAVTSWLSGLGLGTLQLSGTDPGSGGRWDTRQITMTAMDTARLLLLVNGAPGVLWQTPVAVTRDTALSESSRQFLRGLLADQGFNEVLSTSNWCGRRHPVAGIPQPVPQRWIDPATGTVTVAGIPYGQDVRPCTASAQVRFAHKTGLTYNFGADAGIVDALPGQRDRHYVIAVTSDLGYRFADPWNAASPALPCTVDVCYTEAFARLGRAVDAALGAAAPVQPSATAAPGPVVPPSPTTGPGAARPSAPVPGPELPTARPRPAGPAMPVSWNGTSVRTARTG